MPKPEIAGPEGKVSGRNRQERLREALSGVGLQLRSDPAPGVHLLVVTERPGGGSDGVVVATGALLDRHLPQPDARMIKTLAERWPRRGPKELVLLADLNAELRSVGLSFDALDIGWLDVVERLDALEKRKSIDAMRVHELTSHAAMLLVSTPRVQEMYIYGETVERVSPTQSISERDQLRAQIRDDLYKVTQGKGLCATRAEGIASLGRATSKVSRRRRRR